MKRKLSILIDKELLKIAKHKAVEEGRSLGNLVQDAISAYLVDGAPTPHKRKKAYKLFCEQPIRITRRQLCGITSKGLVK